MSHPATWKRRGGLDLIFIVSAVLAASFPVVPRLPTAANLKNGLGTRTNCSMGNSSIMEMGDAEISRIWVSRLSERVFDETTENLSYWSCPVVHSWVICTDFPFIIASVVFFWLFGFLFVQLLFLLTVPFFTVIIVNQDRILITIEEVTDDLFLLKFLSVKNMESVLSYWVIHDLSSLPQQI